MSISAVTAGDATKTGTPSRIDQGALLGKDDFLKLFVAQLQHQDPMSPTEDKEFMGQMAQFSQLEQSTNMADAMGKLSFSGQASQAMGLMGKTIDWEDADGVIQTGVASKVTFDKGEIAINVGSTVVTPGQVRSVQ